MVDTVDKKTRSRMMSGIRGEDTQPEVLIRKSLWHRGFRYTKNDKRYPGKPDIVLSKYNLAIFVHGCFWHQHPDCPQGRRQPKSNLDYWEKKLEATVRRDQRNQALLRDSGWEVLVVWECELQDQNSLVELLTHFLG